MNVREETIDNTKILWLEFLNWDAGAAQILRESTIPNVDSTQPLLLHVGVVEFIDSSGIGSLKEFQRATGAAGFGIVGPSYRFLACLDRLPRPMWPPMFKSIQEYQSIQDTLTQIQISSGKAVPHTSS